MANGVQFKRGTWYRRFKVKRDGRWVDHYVPLPAPDEPGFPFELARVNAAAKAGSFGGRRIRVRE